MEFDLTYFFKFISRAIPTAIVFVIVIIINEVVCRRLYRGNDKTHLLFMQRFIRFFLLILLAIVLIAEYWGLTRLLNLIAGSVAIISGVIGFAAQSVLRDFFAGLMLSIYRPFDIGDRVLLDNVDKPCVVEELTMRDTVLVSMDGIRYIVPNSEIGGKVITNTSYRQSLRGICIQVPISYDSNVPLAIHVMREAVRECPYTCPNNKKNEDLQGYGDVYLMGFESSSLTLETVIWTEPETDEFLACSEVRQAIMSGFREAGIEIPYNYLNVIEKEEADLEQKMALPPDIKLKKRNTRIKTDVVEIHEADRDIKKILEKVEKYAAYHGMSREKGNALRLLAEELFAFSREVTGETGGKFWIEGNRNKVSICLRTKTDLNAERRQELLDLSSSGKNEATLSFLEMLKEMIARRGKSGISTTISYLKYKEEYGSDQNLEKAILTSVADDIKVGIRGNRVEITVRKNFR